MSSYQGTVEEAREITQKRNAEIRAWGRKQLEDADAAAGLVPNEHANNDWDTLSDERIELIKHGIEEAHAGNTRPAQEFFEELKIESVAADPETIEAVETPAIPTKKKVAPAK